MKKSKSRIELNVSEPDSVAKTYIRRNYKRNGTIELRRFNEGWFSWDDGKYDPVTSELFRANLRRWLGKQDLYRYGRQGDLVPTVCTIRTVSEILDGIIPLTILSNDETGFFWVNEKKGFTESDSVVTFQNGLLDVDTGKLYEHTPNWFATSVLPYSYSSTATCPRWLAWLNNICDGDDDWMGCLQKWFGYNLVPDTSRQRFAHFYGPPRSGKGTATRVLVGILGRWNCSNPTLTQLGGGNFALFPLVGKLAAIVSDALIGRSVDSKVVLEVLSTVIGEDFVDIGRKFLPTLTGVKLNTRFTITSNEPLKWPDPTNKLVARSLVFPFISSYVGKEDPSIEQGLMEELPGIANWALEGLKKVRKGEELQAPKSGMLRQQLFSDLDSPILLFCRTCLKETFGKKDKEFVSVPASVIHKVWMAWSRDEGRPTKGQTRTYVRSLIMTALPHVVVKRKGSRGKQEPHYIGLKLTREGRNLLRTADKRKRTIIGFKKDLGV